MRTIIRESPPPDHSEHVIRWTEGDGDECEQRLDGEAAAVAFWNSLHQGTVDANRRVNTMRWHELVQVEDEHGEVVEVIEHPRAHFSHGFGALGVYRDTGATPPGE